MELHNTALNYRKAVIFNEPCKLLSKINDEAAVALPLTPTSARPSPFGSANCLSLLIHSEKIRQHRP